VPRTLHGWLLNGALIASLFAVILAGDKLGGKWATLLFPAYTVTLLVAGLLYRHRQGWPPDTRQRSFRTVGVICVLVAVATGLIIGGPIDAFIAGLGAALGLLIVLGLRRHSPPQRR